MRRQQFRASQTAFRNPRTPSDTLTLIHSYDSDLNPSRPAKSSPLGSSTIAGLPLELLDRLKVFPLFQSAPESFLLTIGKSLRPNVYQPSQEIIREGEDAKALYWLVRGSVRVTSRDGESTYAELRPGAFFGEIGILMDVPRTASVIAATKSLVVRLNKEDLQKELPKYPDVERTIREEALERLAILERKKKERGGGGTSANHSKQERQVLPPRKRSRDWNAGDVEMGEAGVIADGEALSYKKRKSPSPGLVEMTTSSALVDAPLTIRQLLKELPLFSSLPNGILHFLGVNAQPVSFAPFTEILKQGSTGRDVYFIIKGAVEVLVEESQAPGSAADGADGHVRVRQHVKARLKAGQYFGEVTSLSLAPRRTATVRSVDETECLLITGEVLDELWRMCDADLRHQVESEAKRRLMSTHTTSDGDAIMTDAESEGDLVGHPMVNLDKDGAKDDEEAEDLDWRKSLPTVTFDVPPFETSTSPSPPTLRMEPIDPDPFFNANLDNMRAKSRRSSLAPPIGLADVQDGAASSSSSPSTPAVRTMSPSPLNPKSGSTASPASPVRLSPVSARRSSIDRRPPFYAKGRLSDHMLILIFQHLDLLDLMRLRLVSTHWYELLNTSPDILHFLDLSRYNRYVTDETLRNNIVPFISSRPKEIDLSNCFHLTDEGFKSLTEACGEGVKVWKMKSVWDVQGPAVLSLVEKAKGLEEIDLSNCRKIGDNLLARIVGWVVPEKAPSSQQSPTSDALRSGTRTPPNPMKPASPSPSIQQLEPKPPTPGTIIGASKLKRITLSYCKHIQDRSMTHIATHAADRLEVLDLTRCTSISDAGFHSWGINDFKNLRKLVLADCTYLSDQAVVGVVGGCRGLQQLDLSFCCALSDTATEILALGLPALRSLNMAFCGSAISDNSLRCIGLHLLELRYLSVRGCVRVTGHGVESVIEGCRHLEEFDVSQCKNLRGWLERGGIGKINAQKRWKGETKVRFDIVADGTWRTGAR